MGTSISEIFRGTGTPLLMKEPEDRLLFGGNVRRWSEEQCWILFHVGQKLPDVGELMKVQFASIGRVSEKGRCGKRSGDDVLPVIVIEYAVAN